MRARALPPISILHVCAHIRLMRVPIRPPMCIVRMRSPIWHMCVSPMHACARAAADVYSPYLRASLAYAYPHARRYQVFMTMMLVHNFMHAVRGARRARRCGVAPRIHALTRSSPRTRARAQDCHAGNVHVRALPGAPPTLVVYVRDTQHVHVPCGPPVRRMRIRMRHNTHLHSRMPVSHTTTARDAHMRLSID